MSWSGPGTAAPSGSVGCSDGSARSTRSASRNVPRSLAKRSIKRESKLWALDLIIRMIDLTTLEGKDTPGKVHALCQKARRPDPSDATIPSVAAVCVYPARVADASRGARRQRDPRRQRRHGFPSGQTFLDLKLMETRQAVEAGADEVDMVIDRGAFLAGDYGDRLRRDRGRQGGRRRGASQGHPRDRASWGPTTTCGGRASWPWPPAPTSSRPRRAR